MVELDCLTQLRQSARLNPGDWVRYIGADPKLALDYSNQNLQIISIDRVSPIAVCDNKAGLRLVGVALGELEKIESLKATDLSFL